MAADLEWKLRLVVLGTVLLSLSDVRAQVLPPPPSEPAIAGQLSGEPSVFVRGFAFDGNEAFSDEELAEVTASFTNRELTSIDIESARRAVTVHYVDQGYINSGAVIPDQHPVDGVIQLQIIEGQLTAIDLEGNRWLRDGYLTSRVRRWSRSPLNLGQLQEGLQILRQNPNVSQVNAELKPGVAPGESRLELDLEDSQPFRAGIQIDNQRPPSVGAEQFWLVLSDLNLLGYSDPLHFKYGIANATAKGVEFSGLDNLGGSYQIPFTAYETTFGVQGSRLNTSIVEDQFLSLFIESLTTSVGGFVRQPVYQSANQEVSLTAGFDWRINNTRLLDQPFSISPGAVNGEMIVSVFRLSQDWLWRGQSQVLATRSTFNFGLDVLGATDNRVEGDPNGTFFSWVGQAQYIRRLFETQNQLVFRVNGQWTDEPLLALEQISVGGFETVRGYLENQLVRDRGIVSSLEFRLPVLFDGTGAGTVFVSPFFDFGGAWNLNGSPAPTTIASTGVGLRAAPWKYFSAEIYWGYRLREVEIPDKSGLQAHGINFRLNFNAL